MLTLFFYLYVFMIPLEIYLERIPKGPTGINFANISMALLVSWWFLRRSTQGKSMIMKTPLNLPIILLLAWNYFGMVQTTLTHPNYPSAFDPMSESVKAFLQFYNALLLYFIAANMINSRRKIMTVLVMLCLTSVLAWRAFYSDLTSVMTWHYTDNLRVNGPFVWIGSNELGAFFVYSGLFLGLFAFGVKRWRTKAFFIVAGVLYAHGVLYSYSRGTQLAYVGAAALIPMLRYRTTLIIFVALMATSQVWMPASVRDRWAMTTDENGQLESSAQSRKDFSALAWQFFIKSPVIGNGTGSYRLMNPAKMDTHNHYMRTLAEAGLVGFGILAAVWGTTLKMSVTLWRKGKTAFDRHYGFCLMITTVGLMIANLFGDRFTHFSMIAQYWVLVGMGARLYANTNGDEALEESAAWAAETEEAEPATQSENRTTEPPAQPARQPLRTRRAETVRSLAPLNPGLQTMASGGAVPALNLLGTTEAALHLKLASQIETIMERSEERVINSLAQKSQGLNLVCPKS